MNLLQSFSRHRHGRALPLLFAVCALLACSSVKADSYSVQFDAPPELVQLLMTHTDLARFRVQDDVSPQELNRLISEAPAQMRDLLATEGYFNPQFEVAQRSAANAPPQVVVAVTPGPITTVEAVALNLDGAIQQSPDASMLEASFRSGWDLPVGTVFRQPAWDGAKSALLAALWGNRFPAARLIDSTAEIDAAANRARLQVAVDSGPEFSFGAIEVTGLARLPTSSVTNLLTIEPGRPYTQKALLDSQDKLRAVGLFDSVAVEIDTDPATAAAAPVRVRVRERQFQRVVAGIGFTANTGARVSLEHSHLQPFGLRWQSKTALSWAQAERSAGVELTSYPLPGLYRNLLAARATQSDIESLRLHTQRLRVGRTQDSERIERLYYLELERAASTTEGLTNLTASALTANYQWVWRAVDSVVFPTKGLAISAQAGVGTRFGGAFAGRPFGRALARFTAYQPLGKRWLAQARFEYGQVIANEVAGIPQSLLFRAGGDDSVRGYDYQSLGVEQANAVIGGRVLMTASAELSTPLAIEALGPGWLGAVFVDVGDVADRRSNIKRNLGYGLGARWKSPVGPLRIDLAYGHELRKFKLHVGVGIVF
jgi:translocation and assembly module TamA